MDLSEAKAMFGEKIKLGPCVLGENLNLLCARGFAPLIEIAVVSAPDVLDQVTNPEGTQRPVQPARAKKAFIYASESLESEPLTDPRAFTEVLLNIRDMDVVECFDYDTDEPVSLTSMTHRNQIKARSLGIRVDLKKLSFPIPSHRTPKISRFDGNHRLTGMDLEIEAVVKAAEIGVSIKTPSIPYSIFFGLSKRQEEKLFLKINKEQKGVSPAITEHQSRKAFLELPEEDQKRDPLTWVAIRLSGPGGAFENIVFEGGSKDGLKKDRERRVMINNNAVTDLVNTMFNAAPEKMFDRLVKKPDYLFRLVNNYWLAVREVFPEAWTNKTDYILFQTVGRLALAKFWGYIIDEVMEEKSSSIEVFEAFLESIRENGFSLEKSQYKGIAGLAGVMAIYGRIKDDYFDSTDVQVKVASAREMGRLTIDDQIASL